SVPHSSPFSSVVAPRPPFTLFPYTTLFRSSREQSVFRFLPRGHRSLHRICLDRHEKRPADAGVYDGVLTGNFGYLRRGRYDVLGDRKSTRLNSSHSQISYAVFCLKKKKLKR